MTDRSPDPLPRRVLGVWAHPDDESYLSAGLMGRVMDDGGEVTVLTATDGEHGFGPDDPRSPAERAALRSAELRDAMAALGVTDIRRLGLPDGGLAEADDSALAASIGSVIDDVEPDLIVTFGPDGVTGHPDHVCISSVTTRTWARKGVGRLLYACHPAAWWDEFTVVHDRVGLTGDGEPTVTRDEDIVLALELDTAELDRKQKVLAAHDSQTAVLAALMGEQTYRRWSASEWFRSPTSAEIS